MKIIFYMTRIVKAWRNEVIYSKSSSEALTVNPIHLVMDHTFVFHAKQPPLQGSISKGIPET